MDIEELRARVSPVHAVALRAWWAEARPEGGFHELHPAAPAEGTAVHPVSAAVDAGAAVLLLADDEEPGPVARAVTAILCGVDATAVTQAGPSDVSTMRRIAAVRDAMPTLRQHADDLARMLADDPRLGWQASCISHAAARRTPVLLAGAYPHIAALCAQRVAGAIATWVRSGVGDDDAAATAARVRMDLEPVFATRLVVTRETQLAMLAALANELDRVR